MTSIKSTSNLGFCPICGSKNLTKMGDDEDGGAAEFFECAHCAELIRYENPSHT